MKPMKKYDNGGDIPLNKKHLEFIRKRAKKAFDEGDTEKGNKLTRRADKKEARQKRMHDRVERFIAKQQAADAKHAAMKARNPFGSMDAAMDEIERKLDAQRREQISKINTPRPSSKKSAINSRPSTTRKYTSK